MSTPYLFKTPDAKIPKNKVIGLGVFDGVHPGHQAVLEQCDLGITFDPHPDLVLGKTKEVHRLSTLDELVSYFPNLVVLPFSIQLSQLSAEDFLNTIIAPFFDPKGIVVGYDFRFGAKGSGDGNLLTRWGQSKGIAVTCVSETQFKTNQPFKSTTIRDLIIQNQFDTAVEWLGHPYRMIGTVVKGHGRGSKIGFPTANIAFPKEKLIPASGVYKAEVKIGTETFPAVFHIGPKPTFEDHVPSAEAHILNFNRSIYGEKIQIEVLFKIRDNQKFDSPEALTERIKADIDAAWH